MFGILKRLPLFLRCDRDVLHVTVAGQSGESAGLGLERESLQNWEQQMAHPPEALSGFSFFLLIN